MSDRSDLVYAYDGSFVGLMCCIFESYEQKEIPNIIRPQAYSRAFLIQRNGLRQTNINRTGSLTRFL